jgi:ATP/maltotriose-dependent transcriptional regulator MalT
LLDGLALLLTEDRAAAGPALRQAVDRFAAGERMSSQQGLRWGWMGASVLWDDDAGRAILLRQIQLGRDAGALDHLPIDLIALAQSEAWRGDFAAAATLIAEIDAINEITGSRVVPYAAMLLAALRGDDAAITPLIHAAGAEAETGGQGVAVTYARWVTAILDNGHGRYDEALSAARRAVEDDHLYVSMWALPELIEAAARAGAPEVAVLALARLSETTRAGGTNWGLGIEARSRALLREGKAAEGYYREAIERLGGAGLRTEAARAHLLYGEWLRRESRRSDARAQLRIAHEMLDAMGMSAFTERTRRELLATGEMVRRRTVETPSSLSSQETLIVRLAVDGLTNAEIGAQLFLSARTVEWHLRKVFIKLGIRSRRELRRAMPAPG